MDIHFELNGAPVAWEIAPGVSLLKALREHGLFSVKCGCGEGECGACTVLLDGRAVRACLLVVGQANDRRVETVEGLAGAWDGAHPLQQAFAESGAIQCGYCTPGMLLSAKALLDANPAPTEAEVCEALDGNLCRCTGYKKIVEAVLLAAGRMRA